MISRDMRIMLNLHLNDRRAAYFLDSWLDDTDKRQAKSVYMPALERTVSALTTVKLNRLNPHRMGEDGWLSLAAGLAYMSLGSRDYGLKMSGHHLRTYDEVEVFSLCEQWRHASGLGLKYWCYGYDLVVNKPHIITYKHIDKRGVFRGVFNAKFPFR